MSHVMEKMFLIGFIAVVPQMLGAISLNQRQLGAVAPSNTENAQVISGGLLEEVPGTEGMSEMEVVQTLRHDIQLLDEEFNKCEKKRKGWVTATVIGGAGVVGPGIAAIVQGNKIQEKKAELGNIQGQIEGTNKSIEEAQNKK